MYKSISYFHRDDQINNWLRSSVRLERSAVNRKVYGSTPYDAADDNLLFSLDSSEHSETGNRTPASRVTGGNSNH